jgi:hypothetical protein
VCLKEVHELVLNKVNGKSLFGMCKTIVIGLEKLRMLHATA